MGNGRMKVGPVDQSIGRGTKGKQLLPGAEFIAFFPLRTGVGRRRKETYKKSV